MYWQYVAKKSAPRIALSFSQFQPTKLGSLPLIKYMIEYESSYFFCNFHAIHI